LQIDAASDVERSGARVADQIRRCRHAQQAEGHRVEPRVFRPAIVALSDGSEKLVCGKWKRSDGVDLVHEDDETRGGWACVSMGVWRGARRLGSVRPG